LRRSLRSAGSLAVLARSATAGIPAPDIAIHPFGPPARGACYAHHGSGHLLFMLSGYLPIAIFFGLILAFAIVSLVGAWVVRPARPSASKSENYECGAQPIGEAWIQFPVGFYLVALIFLVFDTLAVFFFPWALTIRALGPGGLKAMLG